MQLNRRLQLRGGRQLDISYAGEVALGEEQGLLVGAVEIGAVDRAGEVGDEHPVAFRIQGQADALHQVGKNDFGRLALARRVEGRTAYAIAARRIPTVRPVERAGGLIDVQIDRLRQLVIKEFDVLAIRRGPSCRKLDIRATDAALAGVVASFLGPVEFSTLDVDGDAHAPLLRIRARPGIALTRVDEGLDP